MTDQTTTPPTDGGEETTTIEEADEVGYLGVKADPEPNESYTFNEKAKDLVAQAKGAGTKAPPAKSKG